MGANSISTTDPRIKAAARQLELTMIQRAWVEDGVLYIVTPFETCEVPWTSSDETHTLPVATTEPAVSAKGGNCQGDRRSPSRGPNAPASLDHAKPAESARLSYAEPDSAKLTVGQPPTGGSGHPDTSGASTPSDVASEPPSTTLQGDHQIPADTGLDDFTAIDGVGPAYAAKLHDLGLYTYEQLRGWLADRTYLPGLLPDHTVDSIRAWLKERLV